MKHLSILVILAGCASIAACGRTGDDQAAGPVADHAQPTAQAAQAAPPVEAPITRDSPIWFEPESVSTCEGAAPLAGIVHWNASSFPGVTTVQVTMPAGEGKPDGMFAVSANVGQKETGPWLAAGTEFVLRDNANGVELARAKMPGAACVQ